ncbi:MAG: DUF1553 domain-containing protein, partial [Gemmataceae bacterium]
PDFDKWLAGVKPEDVGGKPTADGLVFHAPLTEGKGNKVAVTVGKEKRTLEARAKWQAGKFSGKSLLVQPNTNVTLNDVGDFDHGQAFSFGAWVRPTPASMSGAVFGRMNEADDFRGWDLWLEAGKVGAHVISKWQSDAVKVVTAKPLKANQWQHVFVTYDGTGKAAGMKIFVDGVEQSGRDVQADGLKGTTRTNVPFKLAQRNSTARLNDVGIQDARIYARAVSPLEVNQLAGGGRIGQLVAKEAKDRTAPEKEELFGYYLGTKDPEYRRASGRLTQLTQEEARLRNRGTIAHVMNEKKAMPEAFILFRGDYDKRRDKVTPGVPAVLPALGKGLPANRLGFAKWLMSDEHPLTTRVTVNRIWQELFGTGLVRTSEDFGISGEQPTHPELLDWLAVEFRDGGWDVKRFYRLLVTSAAYRQAATATQEKREKDPANRLLSRGPRFRMDAEMVRDHALAASGLLVQKFGGESVKPYQPEGVWEAVAMIGSNTRDYKRDTGDKLYRRSLYTFWKRSAPPANMEIFNAPNRELCAVRRERTNTPLQALVTLNDPQFVEAARVLAERAMKAAPSDDARIDFLARRLMARSLRADELPLVRKMLSELLEDFKSDADGAKKLITVGESKPDAALDPAALAGWTMLANALMNLDEVLNK